MRRFARVTGVARVLRWVGYALLLFGPTALVLWAFRKIAP